MSYKGMYQLIFTALAVVVMVFTPVTQAATRSTSLYTEAEKSIYQVQVLNRKTGNRTTIGSGFLVARGDILATNYHVVSEYVNDPANFQLEFFSTIGETGALEVLGVDVLHDLALLKAGQLLGKPLETDKVPEKGAELYSLGNPLDLGFSIVTGTNNGVLSNSEENNILFSGNLNPGMSGGPTLNDAGKVVGVNVATAGNDVSFLVSAQYLDILLERIKLRNFKPFDDLHGDITNQLSAKSVELLGRLADSHWEMGEIGQFIVPAAMERSIKCWDSSKNEDNVLLQEYEARCSNELQIYLDQNLSVGGIRYQYTWYESDSMIAPRFYRNYESNNSSGLAVRSDKRSVTAYTCHTEFVDVSGKDFKITLCRRDYRRYRGLSDVLMTGAMVGESHRGLLFDIYTPGADFQSALVLMKRMLESFVWRK
ncbi:MAG: serine protease [Thiolinea sp.]